MSGKRSLKRGAVVTQKPGEGGVFHRSVSRDIEGLRKKGPDDSATFLHGIKTYLLFFYG